MSLTEHELTAARIIREDWFLDFDPKSGASPPAQRRAYEAIVQALGEAEAVGKGVGAGAGEATGSPGGPECDLETIQAASEWMAGLLRILDQGVAPAKASWSIVHRLDQLLGCDCQAPYAEPGPQLVSNSCPVHNRLRAATEG